MEPKHPLEHPGEEVKVVPEVDLLDDINKDLSLDLDVKPDKDEIDAKVTIKV